MPENPPPLPIPEKTVVAEKEIPAAVFPPAAPLFWRSMAFVVDTSVLGLLGYLITTRFLLPQFKPEELAVFNGWMAEMHKSYDMLIASVQTGNTTAYEAANKAFFDKAQDVPSGAIEVASFFSSCMTFIYWIGFSGMEIGLRGASLGKKMFKLRTATHPLCERPGILDSLMRSLWKALAVGSIYPVTTVFAIVDAHWPLFNKRRRSLHDILCRTVVLDARFDKPQKPAEKTGGDED